MPDLGSDDFAEDADVIRSEDYRRMYERSSIGIFRSTPDGRYLKANPAGVRLHGYQSEAELVAAVRNVAEEIYVKAADRARMARLLEAQGYVEAFECQVYRHKSREPIWVRQNVYRVSDADGRLWYFEGFVENISDRKQVEAALRQAQSRSEKAVVERTHQLHSTNRALREEIVQRRAVVEKLRLSQANLRSVVEQAGDGLFVIDPASGRFVDVNNQACRSLGYTREELLALSVPDIDVEFPAETFRALIAHLTIDETITISGMHRRRDTTLFPVEIRLGLVDLQGESRLLALARDITDKWRAEEALRQSEEDFRQLAEGSIQGILIADARRKPLFCNDECARIFGYGSKEEVLALPNTLPLIASYEVERLNKIREPFLSRPKGPIRYEFDGVKQDGSIINLECVAGTVNWRGRIAAYITLYDVTERKKSEERFGQAQKMETVGQLTGGVAHDFNNLLSIVLGNAELLTDRLGADDAALDAIQKAAERGAELTQRLLAFSRQQPLRPQAIDLGELARSLTQWLARTLGEAVEIATHAEPDLWRALADPGQVENALVNLALNARDAMDGRGRLAVSCRNRTLDGADLAESLEVVAGDYVSLAVSDDGCGMPPEVKAQAFEPFFTTKQVGEGSGLGLSMVYGFAKQSGGFVTIDSEAGRGTTVTLMLPRAEAEAVAQAPRRRQQMPQGEGERILVVEDDVDVRQLAQRMLTALGYEVVAVGDAQAAEQALAAASGIDLILTDVVLSGGTSGPEMVRRLRARHPELRVVFMSGYSADAATGTTFLEDGRSLLTKPFKKRDLARALRAALAVNPPGA